MNNPAEYSKYHMVQDHDALQFLSSVIKKMNWSQPEKDILMDIGCGSGDATEKIILSTFPRLKKIVAIDRSPVMIKFAKENYSNDKIEYHVANIDERDTIKKWEGTISKITSIHCLHWLNDQRDAFKNIYKLLKPGGEAAMLFALTIKHWDSFESVINDPKWNKHLQDAYYIETESHCKKLRASHYRALLEDLHFKVVVCEEVERNPIFHDDQELADQIYPAYGLLHNIPKELENDFKKAVMEAIIKFTGRAPDGRACIRYTLIHLLIQKPTHENCSD